jgi:hypothetical protein
MFAFLKFRSQSDRATTQRPQFSRRPLVEDLEGRQLQSGLAPIQGAHIGVAAEGGGGVGQHIGVESRQPQTRLSEKSTSASTRSLEAVWGRANRDNRRVCVIT